jgi:hypothetical protein
VEVGLLYRSGSNGPGQFLYASLFQAEEVVLAISVNLQRKKFFPILIESEDKTVENHTDYNWLNIYLIDNSFSCWQFPL